MTTYLKKLLLSLLLLLGGLTIPFESVAQYSGEPDSTTSLMYSFKKFNQKMMVAFQVLPFPIFSYSQETGQLFGLVKYNLVQLIKDDTLSAASSFSALASFSTLGQFKFVLGSRQYLFENKIMLLGEFSYIEFPQFILGVGNDVTREGLESINSKSLNFKNAFLYAINEDKTLYAGVFQDYKNFIEVDLDSNSVLFEEDYPGNEGGRISGLGFGAVYDTRDHRYTAKTGFYAQASLVFYQQAWGSDFVYNGFELDLRKYFNPYKNHVIALQAYTKANYGTTPFYALSLLGGTERMRGYYQGAIRDKMIADFQVEYRLPIYKILSMVGFASTGRVAPNYQSMRLDGLWYSGGLGLRIMVDKTNKANLRLDFGWGEQNAKAFMVGFTEAF